MAAAQVLDFFLLSVILILLFLLVKLVPDLLTADRVR